MINDDLRKLLEKRHSTWSKNIDKWRFYRSSYYGGHDYVDSNVLYQYKDEEEGEYDRRKRASFIDNASRWDINTKNNTIFNTNIKRDFGSLGTAETNVNLDKFLRDADHDGNTFHNFMKMWSKDAAIGGVSYAFVNKPFYNAASKMDEVANDVRPFLSMVSVENILDWEYEYDYLGRKTLSMIKVLERQGVKDDTIKICYRDQTQTYFVKYDTEEKTKIIEATSLGTMKNNLMEIPVVALFHEKTQTSGLGISEIADTSINQKSIYNDYALIDQAQKLANSSLLVSMDDQKITLGSGGTVTVTMEQIRAGFKPEYLDPAGSVNIGANLSTIQHKEKAISKNTNMESVTGEKVNKTATGAILERTGLDGDLGDKAGNCELAEENVFKFFCKWESTEWNGNIIYSRSFNTHDANQEITNLNMVKPNVKTELFLKWIEKAYAKAIITDEEERDKVIAEIEKTDFSMENNLENIEENSEKTDETSVNNSIKGDSADE